MIPIEIIILLVIALIVFILGILQLRGFRFDLLIDKLLGKEKTLEKGITTKTLPEKWEFKGIEFENEKGELIEYLGREEINGEKFGIYDSENVVKTILSYNEANILTNIKDVLDGTAKVLRFKVVNNNTYADMVAKLKARDLILYQKEREYERLSRSVNQARTEIKKAENREYKAKYKGITTGRPVQKGKPSSSQESSSLSSIEGMEE